MINLLRLWDQTWEDSPDQKLAKMRFLLKRTTKREWTKAEADEYYKLEESLSSIDLF